MFRQLAQALRDFDATPNGPAPGDPVFRRHPTELIRFLEDEFAVSSTTNWLFSAGQPALGPPNPLAVGTALSQPDFIAGTLPPGFDVIGDAVFGTGSAPLPWEHLIYAYLVESTGVMEILGEVVRRYVIGETLEAPDADTVAWLRTTEELFYRDAPSFTTFAITSQLRPEARINRRNAYWRLFGMDLPQPIGRLASGPAKAVEGPGSEPWKELTGNINNQFREFWSELLRQVWVGITNARNSTGANPTDTNYIAYLCRSLADMAEVRRRGGMLAREEFVYVATLTWFHLTIETDTPLVKALRAETESGNPADRLRRIGERVGMSPSPASRELFELSDQMTVILRLIERRVFDNPEAAQLLFDTSVLGNPIVAAMTEIIDRWASATGDNVKALAVSVNGGPGNRPGAQPLRLSEPLRSTPPAPAPSPVPANGKR